jgi:xanthine dehydrogenase FAD-binding subunit
VGREAIVRYQKIADEQDLLDALSVPGAAILCGGTDLMVKVRAGAIRPEVLLDITHVESMRGIRVTEAGLEIGAAVPESELLASSLVRAHVPLLTSALQQLGSVQIRNRGTLGGNIVNASPAADTAVPLLAYDAAVQIVGPEDEHWMALENFFSGPGRTRLSAGEFVRKLRMPLPSPGSRTFYHKVGRRNALTIAIASLGLLIHLDQGVIRDIRAAVGSVAPTPLRLRDMESHLMGKRLVPSLIEDARRMAMSSIEPISDVRATAAYRRQVIGDLSVRALQIHAP